jgi:hypothetical protein
MSKKLLICFIITIALISFASYTLLKQTITSSTPPLLAETINPSTTSTPPTSVVANTQAVATTSTPATAIEQPSPDMSRLLKLVNDCHVEMINFGDSYGGPSKSIKSVLLKDGTSFDNPSTISASDVLILGATVKALKDKCPIRTITKLLDR